MNTVAAADKLTEYPGKAKVAEFDDLMLGDENILRLDVSVDALQRQYSRVTPLYELNRMLSDGSRKRL